MSESKPQQFATFAVHASQTPELVRLSVGIEDICDILDDLDQAIEVTNGQTVSGQAQSGVLAAQ